VAALGSGQLTGPDGGRRVGQALVCGPAEHDRDCGTCLVQVHLARGPLRPPLRMRLQADHWSSSPPRTALETHPPRARPAQRRLLPGRPPAAGLPGPLARTARADAAHGPRRQPAARGPGPTRAGQVADPTRCRSQPDTGQGAPGPPPGQAVGPAPAAPTPVRMAEYQSTAGQEHDLTPRDAGVIPAATADAEDRPTGTAPAAARSRSYLRRTAEYAAMCSLAARRRVYVAADCRAAHHLDGRRQRPGTPSRAAPRRGSAGTPVASGAT